MQDIQTKRYFFLFLLLIAAVLVSWLLWPFLTIIVLSASLSVVFYPIYIWFKRYVTRNISWLASLLTVLTFLLILIVPLFLLGTSVFEQSQNLYNWITQQGNLNSVMMKINSSLGKYFPSGMLQLEERAAEVSSKLISAIAAMFSATLNTLFGLFLVVLSMFYLLKDGAAWKKTLVQFSPLSDKSDERIIIRLRMAINGIIKGYLLIALVQGLLMGFGLFVAGVPHPALWGVLAGIASLVPTIGTALVSIPAVIYLFSMGETGAAIGLSIWAAAVVGAVDNFLNPIVVGQKIEIHPLLVLFSVLGGLAVMGPIGILIGPLAISFMHALISVYKSEMSS